MALWGLCLVLGAVAWGCSRAGQDSLAQRVVLPMAVGLFFAVVGFARYASYAEEVQAVWCRGERPLPDGKGTVAGKRSGGGLPGGRGTGGQSMSGGGRRPVNRGNPDEFDYVRWRWIQGVEERDSWMTRLREGALSVRQRLIDTYASADMDEQTQAIVAAATLGDRSQLSRDTRDLYAAAGASHLLALSGLHLTIIVGFFLTLLNGRLVMSPWRPWVALGVIVFIWTYALIAGLPTSLVRASLMTTVFIIGAMQLNFGSPMHWLILTALLMLLLRPVWLFDVGAQLSFAAVAGIVILHRRWYGWFFSRWRFQCFWLERYHLMWPFTSLSVSLAAQLATLPLVAYYFHRIPAYAPVFNILFIPLTTAMIYLALVLVLISFIVSVLPFVGFVVPLMGRLLSWIVAVQLAVMQFEVQLPGAVIHDFWSRKAESQVVVYNNWRCPALHVIASPESSWLLMPEPDSLETGMHSIAQTFWQRRLTAEPLVLKGRQALAVADFKAVMVDGNVECGTIVDDGAGEWKETRTKVDILWLTKGCEMMTLGALGEMYAPELLVLDASLKLWQRQCLREEAERMGWSVYDVAAQGALRARLFQENER